MFSIRRVLFPVDFSHQCRSAAPYVADLANRFQAQLHLLHVIEDSDHLEARLRARAGDLAAFAARMPGGAFHPQTVTYGEPARTITRYSEGHDINAIAMPTRGNGTLRRWILGSVTENVLRHASCAVWTESATGHAHLRWSPILCAVDLERGSEQLISYSAALADQFHANLIVVHAVPVVGVNSLWHVSDLPPALSESEAKRKLEELLHGLRIPAELVVATGDVEDVVGSTAERTNARLLAVGRGNSRVKSGALGVHTYELVRTSRCPVVSFPRELSSAISFWTEWQQNEPTPEDLHQDLVSGSAA
jgi:nucleotide-binding universal stress UspA family protein